MIANIKTNCVFCDNEYLAKLKSSKYCSSKCKDKQRYKDNHDSRLASVHEYRNRNRQQIRDRAKSRRQENPEYYKRHNHNSYVKNREKRIADAVQYQKDNKYATNMRNAKRKARELNLSTIHKINNRDRNRLLNRYNNSCAYCNVRLESSGPNAINWDHVIPLIRGGAHGVGNIVPACRTCNLSKHSKTLMEWKLWKIKIR